MVGVCFYFQVHQPERLRKYRIFDIGSKNDYFDDERNKEIMLRVANKCYLPMNKLLLDLINKYGKKFKVAFSISGIAIEQFEKYAPKVLESFQELAKTGCVEFLSETYYHSLCFLYSKEEFREQVELHRKTIKKYFGCEPKIFRNTELVYSNDLAREVEKMGYSGVLAEGWDNILGWRSANHLYSPKESKKKIALFMKNYSLSDDIAFRFSEQNWEHYPLTAEKYSSWIGKAAEKGEIVNLFMDYETFGEHQEKQTGIFDFYKELVGVLLKDGYEFVTPSSALAKFPIRDEIDVPFYVSWADRERDLSAWLSNRMQQEAMHEIYQLEELVKKIEDRRLLDDWRKLTCSDHFYYMSTKMGNDGAVHWYFNPYKSPYDGYVYFMNALNDIIVRIKLKSCGKKMPDLKNNIVDEIKLELEQ
ncbi:MAG: glycoside hydrolase family 57 protein [Nanoarchaeota archaeon]